MSAKSKSADQNIPPAVIATGLLEAMKLIEILWKRQGQGGVSPEFLAAQKAMVNTAADRADELDEPLPGE